MKDKTINMIIISILIVILILFLFVFSSNITSNVIKTTNYSFTKAICNEKNYCMDYQVICQGKKTISINPTGFAVQLDNASKTNNISLEELCQ